MGGTQLGWDLDGCCDSGWDLDCYAAEPTWIVTVLNHPSHLADRTHSQDSRSCCRPALFSSRALISKSTHLSFSHLDCRFKIFIALQVSS
jgi:hypothetical protein